MSLLSVVGGGIEAMGAVEGATYITEVLSLCRVMENGGIVVGRFYLRSSDG